MKRPHCVPNSPFKNSFVLCAFACWCVLSCTCAICFGEGCFGWFVFGAFCVGVFFFYFFFMPSGQNSLKSEKAARRSVYLCVCVSVIISFYGWGCFCIC